MGWKLRLAKPTDGAALAGIYAPFVRETAITFEYDPPSAEEFSKRIGHIQGEYPYLIAEMDGHAIGYAYAARHMERAAYGWNAELSIYLAENARHIGVAQALYGALLALLRAQRVKTVYAVITHPNEASERFHQKLGFAEIGVFKNTGWKLGAWRDVLWMEKKLSDFSGEPAAFRPFPSVSAEEIKRILEEYHGD